MPNVRRQQKEYVEEWRSLWQSDLEAIAFNGTTCDPTRVDPKVLQWVKINCVQKPHFIKIINATAAYGWLAAPPKGRRDQCKLFVPCPFVREHFKKLGRVVALENGTTHEKWKVSFGKPQKVPRWLQGWKRVATGNELAPGDVVVFVLVGDSHFLFHVFDEHGQSKRKPHDPTVKHEPMQQEDDHLPDAERTLRSVQKRKLFVPVFVKPEPRTIHQPIDKYAATNSREEALEDYSGDPYEKSTGGRRKIGTGIMGSLPDSGLTVSILGEKMVTAGWRETTAQQSGEHGDEELVKEEIMEDRVLHLESAPVQELPFDPFAFCIKSRRRVATALERTRAREVAKAHEEVLVGYRFVVVLSAAQVYRDFHVTLPERFVSDTRLPTALTRLQLVDSSGQAWTMYSRLTSGGEVVFRRKYWGVFSLAHLMEEGDVCLFQLKSKDPRTISVRIFRVVQLPKLEGQTNFSVHDHYDMRVKNQAHESGNNKLTSL